MFAIFRTPAALTILLVVAFLCWTTQSVVVDAEQLVQLAMNAELRLHRPPTGETTGARFVPIGLGEPYTVVGDLRATVASGSVATATPLAVASAYMASPFGARLSMSMDDVTAFRAAHAGTIVDRVVSHERAGMLVLSMTVPDGELRTVDLIIDAETYDVMREVLRFPRLGRVEIERLSHAVPHFIPSRPPVGVIASAKRLPSGDALEKAELKARLVLLQSGVDMKTEIHWSPTPALVRIEIAPVPTDQQGRLAARLGAIDHVKVAFQQTAATSLPAGFDPGVMRFGLRQWLSHNFKDPSTRAIYFPRLIHALSTVHQRVGLLAELARRYPDPQGELSPSARAMYQQLVDQHYGRLRRELNESRVWVAPLSGAVHVVTEAEDTPSQLVSRAPVAMTRVTELEQLVLTSLRKSDLSSDEQQRINSRFAALWETIYGPPPSRH